MNQILFTPSKTKWVFKIILSVSIIVIICSLIYFLYLSYVSEIREKNSYTLMQPYAISKLYSSLDLIYEDDAPDFIIGILEIPSISLKVPIISQMNDELLKISVCRFYGPMPNTVR